VDPALARTSCLFLDAILLSQLVPYTQGLSNDRTFNKETSVTRPRGPANDASRTSVLAPLT